uniref:SCP domain-containing protein n=1 Tax=Mesocestoides corti TaxID=53468 RepID=A0A5K3F9I7_MESCO
MQKVICFVILAFAMAAKALTPAERNETIENFANMRSVVEPEASNMQMLRYSAEFEKLAEDWVDDCLMGTKIWDTLPEYRGLGRSFAINFYEQQSPADMVYRFSNEMFNYDYEANTCSEICGNYTQVIWATSNAVGCAIKLCPNIRSESGDPAYLMAYQYKPACNMPGEKPYLPGPACSKCPQTSECRLKQCVVSSDLDVALQAEGKQATTLATVKIEVFQIVIFSAAVILSFV